MLREREKAEREVVVFFSFFIISFFFPLPVCFFPLFFFLPSQLQHVFFSFPSLYFYSNLSVKNKTSCKKKSKRKKTRERSGAFRFAPFLSLFDKKKMEKLFVSLSLSLFFSHSFFFFFRSESERKDHRFFFFFSLSFVSSLSTHLTRQEKKPRAPNARAMWSFLSGLGGGGGPGGGAGRHGVPTSPPPVIVEDESKALATTHHHHHHHHNHHNHEGASAGGFRVSLPTHGTSSV